MKILEELWYSNVLADERAVGQASKAHKLGGYILRHEEDLMPLLSVQAKTVYEKIRENLQELHSLNECEAFCLGFRLGARITYEVMDGTSDVPSIDD